MSTQLWIISAYIVLASVMYNLNTNYSERLISSICFSRGAGEANFLGGVAKKFAVPNFDVIVAKKRFFQIYIDKVLHPGTVSCIQATK